MSGFGRVQASSDASPGVSVVVPTYNEAQNLPVLLPSICNALQDHWRFEVLVVDDGSPDRSAAVAESISQGANLPVRVLRRDRRYSLASAVICGAHAAKHDCVAVLDADLSHDPRMLPQLLQPVIVGAADVAIGSRYCTGGEIKAWKSGRRILSFLGTFCAQRLSSVTDPLSGFFACRRDLLLDERLFARGYKILLEVLARLPRLRVCEIPITFIDRALGQSKLRLPQELAFLGQLLSLSASRSCGQLRNWCSSSQRAHRFRNRTVVRLRRQTAPQSASLQLTNYQSSSDCRH